MNTEPKPATGEWTVRTINDLLATSFDLRAVARAHNAALAAEREKVREAEAEQKATEAGYDMIAQENRQLRAQLAAEKERADRMEKLLRSMPRSLGITERDLK